jgi:hypothetical protein
MRLIGCDLHASQQSIAMLDRDTGVVVEKTLKHEGEAVREFYAAIPPPVVVGIEATGSMGWFLRLMEELAIECRVGQDAQPNEGWRLLKESHYLTALWDISLAAFTVIGIPSKRMVTSSVPITSYQALPSQPSTTNVSGSSRNRVCSWS